MTTRSKSCCALVLALLMLSPVAYGAASLDALVQQSKVQAQKTDQGYKIYVEENGDAIAVLAEEEALGNSEIKVVNLYVLVLELPKDFQQPPQMLKKILEVNSNINYGKLVQEDNYILYKSTFLLKNADADAFQIELAVAYAWRGELRKALTPFVKE